MSRAVTLPGKVVGMRAAQRPVQFQQDAIEIADAYLTGGNRLARLVFNSIVDARKLKLFESVVLRGDVRDRLVKAGVKFSV